MKTVALLCLLVASDAFAEEVTRRGAPLGDLKPTKLTEVLSAPDKFAGKRVVVDGKVRANCTRKGCWMELATALDKDAKGCRVTFKDYGFFVPLDAKGSTARVDGVVTVRTLPPAEVAHLESEGGHFAKEKDGSAKEVQLVATGVELRR